MKEYLYPEDQLPTPQTNKLLALVGTNKNVLEVGCAMGYQTRSMLEIQNCKVSAIEIDEVAAEQARPYCDELFVGNIESMNLDFLLKDKKFNVVTFADVLEHLYSPTKVLNKIRPFIDEGGYIVASIPNITHCSVIYEMAHGQFKYRKLGLLDDTHIRFFSRQTIYQTFEEAGYLIVSFQRNTLNESETEFNTNLTTEEDHKFIEYIKQRNAEAQTYQFIIKAIPLNDVNGFQTELITAQEQLELLKNNALLNEKKINRLESNIAWMKSPISYRFLSYLKRIFKR